MSDEKEGPFVLLKHTWHVVPTIRVHGAFKTRDSAMEAAQELTPKQTISTEWFSDDHAVTWRAEMDDAEWVVVDVENASYYEGDLRK